MVKEHQVPKFNFKQELYPLKRNIYYETAVCDVCEGSRSIKTSKGRKVTCVYCKNGNIAMDKPGIWSLHYGQSFFIDIIKTIATEDILEITYEFIGLDIPIIEADIFSTLEEARQAIQIRNNELKT